MTRCRVQGNYVKGQEVIAMHGEGGDYDVGKKRGTKWGMDFVPHVKYSSAKDPTSVPLPQFAPQPLLLNFS